MRAQRQTMGESEDTSLQGFYPMPAVEGKRFLFLENNAILELICLYICLVFSGNAHFYVIDLRYQYWHVNRARNHLLLFQSSH